MSSTIPDQSSIVAVESPERRAQREQSELFGAIIQAKSEARKESSGEGKKVRQILLRRVKGKIKKLFGRIDAATAH